MVRYSILAVAAEEKFSLVSIAVVAGGCRYQALVTSLSGRWMRMEGGG